MREMLTCCYKSTVCLCDKVHRTLDKEDGHMLVKNKLLTLSHGRQKRDSMRNYMAGCLKLRETYQENSDGWAKGTCQRWKVNMVLRAQALLENFEMALPEKDINKYTHRNDFPR